MFTTKTIQVLLIVVLFSVKNTSIAQEKHEVFPDYSYDEIADRISCMQTTIPLRHNKYVAGFVDYFAIRNRAYTRDVIKKTKLYFPLFEKKLAKYNLPDELKYLSIVESGLKPQAVSRASAVGLWQFISSTGRHYKLYSNWYVDDRMNPEKATEAACKFLKSLYNMFGDWELALAAYNCGPGNVRKAIRRSGNRRSFWGIYRKLPRETRSYVPQFNAITYLFNHLEEHGFATSSQEHFPQFDTLQISQYFHIETFCKQLNECTDDVLKWNPSIKRTALPDGTNKFALKVPVNWKDRINARRAFLFDTASKVGKKHLEMLARNTPGSVYGRQKRIYRVRSGDVLGKIAQKYHVRVSDLRKWNKIRGSMIRVGQRLNIWVLPNYSAQSKSIYKAPKPKTKTPKPIISGDVYKVKSGDSLWTISRASNVSVEKIKTANQLTSNKIKPGQSLIIPE